MDGAGVGFVSLEEKLSNGFVSLEEKLSWLQAGHSSGDGAEERGTKAYGEKHLVLCHGAGERPRSPLCVKGCNWESLTSGHSCFSWVPVHTWWDLLFP